MYKRQEFSRIKFGFIHKSVTAVPLNWASVKRRTVSLNWYQTQAGNDDGPSSSAVVLRLLLFNADRLDCDWDLTSESSNMPKLQEQFESGHSELKLISVWLPLLGRLKSTRGIIDSELISASGFIFSMTCMLLVQLLLNTALWNCSDLNIVLEWQPSSTWKVVKNATFLVRKEYKKKIGEKHFCDWTPPLYLQSLKKMPRDATEHRMLIFV